MGDAERLMNLAEVVIHEMERNGMSVILDLLAEGVRQPSEAAHVHPHGQVLALDVTGRDMTGIRIASDRDALRSRFRPRTLASW